MASDCDVLILGGRGLVGSAFTRFCARAGFRSLVVGRAEYAAMAGRSCDILVNANGNSSKPMAAREPLAEFDASVRSVRASLADFRFRKYVHISSCDVYPDCSSPAFTGEEQPPDPARQSPYGFHKHLAEQCVMHGASDWLIFRCGGFVGPGLRKNAIFDILHGGPLFLDPESELQFLHTDRAAEIVFRLVEQGLSREVFNLCGRGLVRLAEVAAVAPGPVPVKPGSPRVRYEVSIDKISRRLEIPATRAAVLDWVRAELAARGAAGS
jgi:nucleoside-diphosphate-sugar epimerase